MVYPVLVIEDNPEMRILIEHSLSGLKVDFAPTLAIARQRVDENTYSLILLDLNLPDGDGMQLLVEWAASQKTENLPVLVLTGKNETVQKVTAFSMGAEDFIVKPFEPLELRARCEAKIRKTQKKKLESEKIQHGELLVDLSRQMAEIQGASKTVPLHLTAIEFRLLSTFAQSPERVHTRESLLDRVWGNSIHVTDRTVDAHVANLRKKLGKYQNWIQTVVGSGYRFKPELSGR